MRKLLTFWIAPSLFVAVVVFLIFFILHVNETPEVASLIKSQKNSNDFSSKDKLEAPALWIKEFAAAAKPDTFFPITEVVIELDLVQPVEPQRVFKLIVERLDSYEFFCLRQVLKQFNAKFHLQNEHGLVEITLFSKEKEPLEEIVKALKIYEINSKIIEINKEKNV